MRRTLFLLAALSVFALAGAGRAALAASAPETRQAMPGGMDNATAMPAHMHPAPQKDAKKDGPPGVRNGAAKDDDDDAAVVEKIGQHAALDVELYGEDGARLRLADLVTMPTIIAPVYYSCPNECNVLLGTLGQVLPQVGLRPGVDYQVLAISFDELDTPATATKRKGDFLNTTSAGFPPQAWRFLTGDEKNVRRLMDSLGFSYARTPTGFRHSVVLIALTPTGKISRYLYGIRPLAFDIAMAATEAGAEKTGLSVKRAIAMCYTYDPQGRRYVFDIVKVTGAGVLFALALFGLFLAFGGKRRGGAAKPPKP
jgi:protein SCO1/2